jgi:hypothetical protein
MDGSMIITILTKKESYIFFIREKTTCSAGALKALCMPEFCSFTIIEKLLRFACTPLSKVTAAQRHTADSRKILPSAAVRYFLLKHNLFTRKTVLSGLHLN